MKPRPKKSKVSALLHPTKFVKKRKDGTVRIVRDSYSNAKQSWWDVNKRILERDGHQCRATIVDDSGSRRRCPHSKANGHRLEVHHILPLSKGGKTVPANLITLCERCHRLRHQVSHRHQEYKGKGTR